MTGRTSRQSPLKRKRLEDGTLCFGGGRKTSYVFQKEGLKLKLGTPSMIFQNLPLAEAASYPSISLTPICLEPTNLRGHDF